MKMNQRITASTVAVAMLVGLSGCGGMTQREQNTAVGAGIGAVGGAVVGGVIGHEVGR